MRDNIYYLDNLLALTLKPRHVEICFGIDLADYQDKQDYPKPKGVKKGMANNNGKVEKGKIKRMVEDWEGRKFPKNVNMKTLLDRLAQEKWVTEVERSESHDRE